MKNRFITAFYLTLYLSSVAYAWVCTPTNPATVIASHTTGLSFRPRTSSFSIDEEDKSTKSLPYKVSTLRLSSAHEQGAKASAYRRRTLWGQVQQKTVGFLMYTYELDRKEFGYETV